MPSSTETCYYYYKETKNQRKKEWFLVPIIWLLWSASASAAAAFSPLFLWLTKITRLVILLDGMTILRSPLVLITKNGLMLMETASLLVIFSVRLLIYISSLNPRPSFQFESWCDDDQIKFIIYKRLLFSSHQMVFFNLVFYLEWNLLDNCILH